MTSLQHGEERKCSESQRGGKRQRLRCDDNGGGSRLGSSNESVLRGNELLCGGEQFLQMAEVATPEVDGAGASLAAHGSSKGSRRLTMDCGFGEPSGKEAYVACTELQRKELASTEGACISFGLEMLIFPFHDCLLLLKSWKLQS